VLAWWLLLLLVFARRRRTGELPFLTQAQPKLLAGCSQPPWVRAGEAIRLRSISTTKGTLIGMGLASCFLGCTWWWWPWWCSSTLVGLVGALSLDSAPQCVCKGVTVGGFPGDL